MSAEKRRADLVLVERGLIESRARAQAEIAAGNVFAAGRRVAKSSETIAPDAELELRGRAIPHVSRGGLKLAAALDHYGIDVTGRIALDVGASTGGFTQVLLERGARKVFAVDVGRDQLHESLRTDARVVDLFGIDIRDLTSLREQPTLAVIDVSFIGLEKVLPAVFALLAPRAEIVVLIKPQFEVGKKSIGKGGIVRDADARSEAVLRICTFIAVRGWRVADAIESPVTGGDGNIEYLVAARRG